MNTIREAIIGLCLFNLLKSRSPGLEGSRRAWGRGLGAKPHGSDSVAGQRILRRRLDASRRLRLFASALRPCRAVPHRVLLRARASRPISVPFV